MPATFPTRVTNALTALSGVTGGAVTFADRVVAVINEVFGASNPFGTAATRDTGTAEGNVPVLGADGNIANTVLPLAATDRAGLVRVAPSLDGAATGDVATAAQITAEAARLTALFGGVLTSNFQIFDMASPSPFVTTRGGLIIASGATGEGAGDTTISVDATPQNPLITLTARKSGQTITSNTRVFDARSNYPFLFYINMIGKGLRDRSATVDAGLLIAATPTSGGTFNVSVGAAGILERNPEVRGQAGFAWYLQLN